MEPAPPPDATDEPPGPVGDALADPEPVDRLEEEATLASLEARMFGEQRRIRVDRYELGESLGRGAAGDVYLAHDPRLEREVAIKLLRPMPGERGDRARRRFLREARAIAQLSHPNVVEIFDAGDFSWSSLPGEAHDDGVYIVMERVRGHDLERWLREDEREPAQILEYFVRAGRGLAAAHREGIVHRDFKPSNVLVSSAGSVKVADFGLALLRGSEGSSATTTGRVPAEEPSTVGEDARLTRTGAMLGTPLYMAPEQHRGLTADARADQFAFCASLLGALFGRPPYVGDDPGSLLEAKLAGPPSLPRSSPIPRGVARALARGLAPEPDRRWSSMEGLLRALESRPGRSRPLVLLGVAAAASLGAALMMPSRAPARRCDPTARIEAVWSEAHRESLRARLGESTVPFAEATRERLELRLDARAERWGEHYRQTCEDQQHDAEARDLHMLCLLRQLEQIDSLVRVVTEGEASVLERALSAEALLPDPARCRDSGYVDAVVGPPPDRALAGKVEALRERIVQLETLEHLGRYRAAMVQARGIAAEAERLGHDPVLAHALQRRGSVEEHAGKHDAAAKTLEQAFFVAQRIPDPARATEIATLQVYIHGHRLRSFDAAEQWARHAEAALRQHPDPKAEADLLDTLAALDIDERRYEDALAGYRRALDLRQEHADPLSLGTAYNNIATALDYLGRHEQALDEYELALSIRREHLGPAHPDVATVLYNLGNSSHKAGDPERALDFHRQALEIREQSLGPSHLRTGHSVNNIAALLMERGELDQAQAMLERTLEIWEASLGEDHPYVAGTTSNLAQLQRERGLRPQARRTFERALELARNAHGADHPQVILVLSNLAGVLAELDEHELSIARYEEGLALHEREPGPPEIAGDLCLGLSMTLTRSDGDPTRARELAEQAIVHYEAAGSRASDRMEEARRWQAELP